MGDRCYKLEIILRVYGVCVTMIVSFRNARLEDEMIPERTGILGDENAVINKGG